MPLEAPRQALEPLAVEAGSRVLQGGEGQPREVADRHEDPLSRGVAAPSRRGARREGRELGEVRVVLDPGDDVEELELARGGDGELGEGRVDLRLRDALAVEGPHALRDALDSEGEGALVGRQLEAQEGGRVGQEVQALAHEAHPPEGLVQLEEELEDAGVRVEVEAVDLEGARPRGRLELPRRGRGLGGREFAVGPGLPALEAEGAVAGAARADLEPGRRGEAPVEDGVARARPRNRGVDPPRGGDARSGEPESRDRGQGLEPAPARGPAAGGGEYYFA